MITFRFISIFIALAATLATIALYVSMYRRGANKRIGTIGFLNILIGVTMIIVVLPSNQSSTTLESIINEGGLLFISLFIVSQALYLLTPFSPLRHTPEHVSEKSLPLPTEYVEKNNLSEKLRKCLKNTRDITQILFIGMSEPVDLFKLYVPIQVQNARIGFARAEINEKVQNSVGDLLKKEKKRLETLERDAESPTDIIFRESWKHCVLLGEPGVGKTTFLHYLALQIAQNVIPIANDLTPIYIRLNDFLANLHDNKSLLTYITSYYVRTYSKYLDTDADNEIIYSFLKEQAQRGKLILLLDGLDETVGGETQIQSKKNYDLICQAIEEIANDYADIRILVTSRKASYTILGRPLTHTTGEEFRTLEILGFLDEQKRTFVRRFLDAYLPQNSPSTIEPDALIIMIRQEQHLNDLSRLPLLLNMITLAYSEGYNIVHRRAEIYDKCIHILLTGWDGSRGITRFSEFYPYDKYRLLEKIAWEFHNRRLDTFDRNDVINITKDFLAELGQSRSQSQTMIDEIVTEGLLKAVRPDAYSFSHRIFQEYFTAQWCVDDIHQPISENGTQTSSPRLQRLDTLLQHQGDSWWEETILLYAAYSKTNEIGQWLLAPEREDIFYTNLLLVGRYVSMSTENPFSYEIAQIKERLLSVLDNAYEPLQERIVTTLAEIAKGEINEELMGIIVKGMLAGNTTTHSLRIYTLIAKSLGKWGDKQILQAFLQILLEVPEGASETARGKFLYIEILCAIVLALAQHRDKQLATRLLPLLVSASNLKFRLCLAYTIGRLGKSYGEDEISIAPQLVEKLSMLSSYDSDERVRGEIIQSLERLSDPVIIPELLETLAPTSHFTHDDQVQIIHVICTLLPLSSKTKHQEDAISHFAASLERVEAGSQLAQAYILTLGNCLKYVILTDFVKQKLENLQQVQKENFWLKRRITILLTLFVEKPVPDEDKSSQNNLLTGNPVVDNELIDFIDGLELSLIEDDNSVMTFFKSLIPLALDTERDSIVRQKLIKLWGKVANQEMARELLSILYNESVDDKIFDTVVKAVQTLYSLGRINTVRATEDLLSLLNLLSQRDAEGRHLVDIAEILTIIAPSQREMTSDKRYKAIQDLQNSTFRKKELNKPFYTLALGFLGDRTAIPELIDMLCRVSPLYDKSITLEQSIEQENHIRKKIVRILERLTRQRDAVDATDFRHYVKKMEIQLNNSVEKDKRWYIVEALQIIAKNADNVLIEGTHIYKYVCEILIRYIEDEDVSKVVYESVEQISTQKHLRVYRDEQGQIQVMQWPSAINSQFTA